MNQIALIIFILSAISNVFYNKEAEPKQIAEKVYLHIDRDYYNSGDDIWFKSYVIDPSTNKLSPNTNNLHVELISPTSDIIQSRVVRINDGIGNGDFHLSDSLPSGRYRIRAYTNFMRNFDDHFFFGKEIFVINPLDGGNELNDSIEYIENKIDINFFPEGGSLVDNVKSIVAFKALNALGNGCDITGEVFSSSGDLVTNFKSTHLGMGVFNLNSVSGLEYYAVIKNHDGAEFRADIPKSFSTGVTIHVVVTQDKKLLLKVFTNKKTLPSIIDHELIISFSSRNLITKNISIKINSLVNNFLIPMIDFPDGIIRVTLSGIEGMPLCERLVYLQKSNDLNVIVSTDKLQYIPREQVTINISISGDTAFQDKAFLSLSATEKRIGGDSSLFPTSISSWFLLESDVRGPIENPSQYFDLTNNNRFQDLDLLLLTQGWRDFQWKYDSSIPFKHEIGFSISGRVKRVFSNKPIEGTKINIGIFGNKAYSFLTTTSDSMGRFSVEEINITGKAKVIVTTTGKEDEFEGWLILDSLFYLSVNVDDIITQTQKFLPINYSELKQEAIVKYAIQKKYKLSDTINIGEVIIVSKKPDSPQETRVKMGRSLYGRPDKELIITSSLERYTNIFQAISGKIMGVRTTESSITIRGQTPLLLRDGIPARLEDILSLPTYMVDRVDVLNWSPLFGKSQEDGVTGANGVINFITKTGAINYSEKPLFYSTSLNLNGFDAPRIFYSPKYNTPQTSAFMPDTRSTIYWEPNIITGDNNNVMLSYFNADKTTTVEINIEGITSEGIPVTGKTRYEVR